MSFIIAIAAVTGLSGWLLLATHPWRHGAHEARRVAASPATRPDPFWGSMDLAAERELHHEPWPPPDLIAQLWGPQGRPTALVALPGPGTPVLDGGLPEPVAAILAHAHAQLWAYDQEWEDYCAQEGIG